MLKPGVTVGGLVIGELLGRGAMGEVYRAQQVSLNRPVAVKRIAEHLADDEQVVARFSREAQCIARVSSPHVLGVYEFGRFEDDEGDHHWLLVMELVEGGYNARELLRRGLDWRQASAIVMQVAEGLAEAAEHGIVHRDIKPDNIMVTAKGVAKLADFGLAKAADSLGMTMEGALMGTPYYMPPEACRGEVSDHRGDLYSLAATWYHLLSGRPVFQGSNTMMLLRAHAEDTPQPITELVPDLPPPLAKLLHACLAKDPQKRPASAEVLVQTVQDLSRSGIVLPRQVADALPESGSKSAGPKTAPTARANDQWAPTLDQQNTSTIAAELASAAPRRRYSGLLMAVATLVLVGVLGSGLWLLLVQLVPPAVEGPDAGQQGSIDTPEAHRDTPPHEDAQPPTTGPQVPRIPEDPGGGDGAAVLFSGVEEAVAAGDPARAWALLETVASREHDAAVVDSLRQEIIRLARERSAATLTQGIAQMQEGDYAGALRRLEAAREVARIAGEGDRYDEVLQRLRQALAETDDEPEPEP